MKRQLKCSSVQEFEDQKIVHFFEHKELSPSLRDLNTFNPFTTVKLNVEIDNNFFKPGKEYYLTFEEAK